MTYLVPARVIVGSIGTNIRFAKVEITNSLHLNGA
jgi:hypothetical protein